MNTHSEDPAIRDDSNGVVTDETERERLEDARTCIIGAGPGGLTTATVFQADGFDVTVFEKGSEVGGTWSSQNRYLNLSHQLPEHVTEFIGKPWGAGYASATEFQSYQREYADEFGVTEHIQFETEVTNVEREGSDWIVTTRDLAAETHPIETHRFDLVVVCSGAHHIPKRIELPNETAFDGAIYHSSEIKSADVLENNDIVVVGCGKSAADICTEAAERAATTTMVFRNANWFPPKRFWGVLPQSIALYTRISEALLPRYYNEETWRWPDRVPKRLKDLSLSLFEHGIRVGGSYDEFPDELVPESSILAVQRQGVMPDGFSDHVQSGRITAKKATIDRLDANGATLSTGEYVEADVIVVATGYRNEYPFLPDSIDLKNDDDQFHLYRGIVPPETHGIGIIGRREVLNNFLSMNLSAHWLSAYFRDELAEIPTAERMHETIETRLAWMDETVPLNEGYYYGAYDIHTFDELLIDMGLSTSRRRSILSEWIGVNARGKLYDGLHEERRRSLESRSERTLQTRLSNVSASSLLLLGLGVLLGRIVRSRLVENRRCGRRD